MITPAYDHPVYVPGDVIVEAMPLVYSLDPRSVGFFCNGCFRSVRGSSVTPTPAFKLAKCGKCFQFEYCGRECQKFDWRNFHKHECQLYAEHGHKTMFHGFGRAAIRCLILMQQRPEELTKQYNVLGGGKRCFMDLIEHKEELEEDVERKWSFRMVIESLSQLGLKFDAEKLLPILRKFSINTFSILDLSLNSIGSGLYIETSIFDHSCAPNAGTNYHGLKMQVRALKDIPSQEAICVGYDEIIQLRSTRQAKLLKSHCFTCQCVRCSGDSSKDDRLIEKIIPLREKIDQLSDTPYGTYILGPWKQMSKLYDKLLPLLEQAYGQYNPGLTAQYMNCIKVKMNADTLAGFDFEKVSRAIKVTHGSDHILYRQFIELRERIEVESQMMKNLNFRLRKVR